MPHLYTVSSLSSCFSIYMHTIHVILLENDVLFILVFYIVIYLIIPVVIVVLKCIVLISTVLFKVSLLYPEKSLIIENKICHCHCHVCTNH